MNKVAVIAGTSRYDGHTANILSMLKESDVHNAHKVFSLIDYDFDFYDYEQKNKNDDFLKLIREAVNFDVIIFLTPVYWYSMSAQMKVFFDRLSDLLTIEKPLGRALKGKKTYLIAHGSSDAELPEGFEVPFSKTSAYFNMEYQGCFYFQIQDNVVPADKAEQFKEFNNRIFASSSLRVNNNL